MKAFVTGVGGQLGHDVIRELSARGHIAIGSDITDNAEVKLDITDDAAVQRTLDQIAPDVVIHCAAWTAVDAAEESENAPKVRAINATATQSIATACQRLGCKLIYISTDYVFNGQGSQPWPADCPDYAPLNVYGETKLAGEQAVRATTDKHFIVRIAWVFGRNGKNFIRTMLALSEKYEELRVVCDQIGTPTYTYDLARLLIDMAETERYGTYHATNEGGYISWADFASAIFNAAGKTTRVIPVTTAEYGLAKAARPFYSRLDKSKLLAAGFTPLPTWQSALTRYLRELATELPDA